MTAKSNQDLDAQPAPTRARRVLDRLEQWLPGGHEKAPAEAGANKTASLPQTSQTGTPADVNPGSASKKTRPSRPVPEPRTGEAPQLRFRTDRIFNENGAWYFTTREGINVGPYDDPETARREARRLARMLAERSALSQGEQNLIIQQFMRRPTFGKP